MARHPLVDKFDFSRLRTVVCAAAPLGESLTLEFQEKRKGLKIKQGKNALLYAQMHTCFMIPLGYVKCKNR